MLGRGGFAGIGISSKTVSWFRNTFSISCDGVALSSGERERAFDSLSSLESVLFILGYIVEVSCVKL